MSVFRLEDRSGFFLRTARSFAVVAGFFCLILSVLAIANYIQLRTSRPLDNESLSVLRGLYNNDQDDENLKEQIRVLDLVSRKAYFTKRWQLETIGYMLLAGLAVMIGSLKTISVFSKKLPAPAPSDTDDRTGMRKKTRLALSVLGAAVIAASGVFLVTSNRIMEYEYGGGTETETGWDSFPADAVSNWPSFRGPGSIGVADGRNPPIDWDGESGRNVIWKTKVALPGMSSPVVWEGSVFLTGAQANAAGIRNEVYSFDSDTGELAWTAVAGPFPGSPAGLPDLEPGAGYAAPTAAADDTYVCAIFASGDLVCLDHSGKPVWGLNVGYVEDLYGHSSSLLIFESTLIVQYDHGDSAFIAGYDLRTGGVKWKRNREVYDTWSSPLLTTAGGEWLLVVNATPYAAAYNPRTGEELWRVEDILGEVASSPAGAGDKIVIVNQLLNILCVEAGTGNILWELYDDLPDSSSPLAYDDRLVIATAFGVVTSVGLSTGEIIGKQEFPDGFYASPVLSGERVFATDRRGITRIFPADGDFLLLASPALGEAVDATPAFVGDRIYIRGHEHLFCLGESGE